MCPQVFAQTVWALARLAPGRYASLFDSLALSYAAKLAHTEQVAIITTFDYPDRATLLAAFAAVAEAQGGWGDKQHEQRGVGCGGV